MHVQVYIIVQELCIHACTTISCVYCTYRYNNNYICVYNVQVLGAVTVCMYNVQSISAVTVCVHVALSY